MSHVVVTGLSKRFAGHTAIDDVSFMVPQGGFLALLGPSGSGKTTTLMALAGFVLPDHGRIEVAGRDITRLPPNRRGLGIVFQSYALFPHRTVRENVAFPLDVRKVPHNESAARVSRMLELVRLAGFEDRAIPTLSGGQKQRVALARALVFDPPVVLMDEPLGALDRDLREQLQGEIKAIQRATGVTCVFVTHDQDEALAMSDLVAVMRDGRLEQIGSPREVYDRPATRFVAEFLGGVNLLPIDGVLTDGTSIRVQVGPQHFAVAAGADARSGMWLAVRPEKMRLHAAGSRPDLLDGTVTDRTFVGTAMVYQVRTGQRDAVVTVRTPLSGEDTVFDVGDAVGISWAMGAATVLA